MRHNDIEHELEKLVIRKKWQKKQRLAKIKLRCAIFLEWLQLEPSRNSRPPTMNFRRGLDRSFRRDWREMDRVVQYTGGFCSTLKLWEELASVAVCQWTSQWSQVSERDWKSNVHVIQLERHNFFYPSSIIFLTLWSGVKLAPDSIRVIYSIFSNILGHAWLGMFSSQFFSDFWFPDTLPFGTSY